MRKHKFKAWHKIEKRWINLNGASIEFLGCTNPGIIYAVSEQGVLNEIDIENVELIEWTGLLDKNGVEIYEGDIVKTDRLHICEIRWDLVNEEGEKDFYMYTGFCFHHIAQNKNYHLDEPSRIEIIGNIYENPELLTF